MHRHERPRRYLTSTLSLFVIVSAAHLITVDAAMSDTWYVPADFTTIQGAIDAAAQAGDEIIVAPGTYNEAINLLGKELYLHSSDGRDVTTIDATGLDTSVVTCTSGETLNTIIEGFTITGGTGTPGDRDDPVGGGFLILSSSPHVRQCAIVGNTVEGYWSRGGGMYVGGNSSPAIRETAFRLNSAQHDRGGPAGGGAFCGEGSAAAFFKCFFFHNLAAGGGGISSSSCRINLQQCLFVANGASGHGAGVMNSRCTGLIRQCAFNENVAGHGAGLGIAGQSYDISVVECEFSRNRSIYTGGGIYVAGATGVVVEATSFHGNRAKQAGGGVYVGHDETQIQVVDCHFERNTAQQGGGGILVGSNDTIEIIESMFIGNQGSLGGAIKNSSQSALVSHCWFVRNRAGSGGAISNGGAHSGNIINSLFAANTATAWGGAISNYSSPGLNLFNCVLVGNACDEEGGGIRNDHRSDGAIVNTIIRGNQAPHGEQIFNEENSTTQVAYSNVAGSHGSGEAWNSEIGVDLGGNIDAEPMFVNPGSGNFRLTPGSPCIDAGYNTVLRDLGITKDLDRHPRFVDNPYISDTGGSFPETVDMGPFEFLADTHPTLEANPDTVSPGEELTFTLYNCRGHSTAYLFYSLDGYGRTFIPELNVPLDLANVHVYAESTVTNRDGAAKHSVIVPAGAAGLEIWFQVAQQNLKTTLIPVHVN